MGFSQYPSTTSSAVPTYANQASLPASADDGALAVTLDLELLWVFDTTTNSWKIIGGVGVPTQVGNLDGAAGSAKGAVLGSASLFMQSATAVFPGLVSSASQTFAGNKTFTGSILSGTDNTGTIGSAASSRFSAGYFGTSVSSGRYPFTGGSSGVSVLGGSAEVQFYSGGASTYSIDSNVAGLRIKNVGTGVGIFQSLDSSFIFANSSTGTPYFQGSTGSVSVVSSAVLVLASLTGGLPLQLNGNLNVVSSTISLESQVSGNLPLSQTSGSLSLENRVSGNLPLSQTQGSLSLITQVRDTLNLQTQTNGSISLISQVRDTLSLATQTNSSLSLTTQVTGNLPLSQTSGSISLISQVRDTLSLATQTNSSLSLTTQVVGILPVANGGSTGSNTGDVSLTAVGTSPANAGASLSGQVLTLQPANATNPGVVSSTSQDFLGAKTFLTSINSPSIIYQNAGAHPVTVQTAASTSTYSLQWPPVQGTLNQTLLNNGNGSLSWSAVLTNPMTTSGDIIVGSGSGVTQRLAVGTEGQYLVANSSSSLGLSYRTIGSCISATYICSSGTFVDSAETVIDFPRLVFDNSNSVTVGSNWAFVAQKPGLYLIQGQVGFGGSGIVAGGMFTLRLYKNTSREFAQAQTIWGLNGFDTYANINTVMVLNPNDRLQLRLRNDTGATLDINVNSTSSRVSITSLFPTV